MEIQVENLSVLDGKNTILNNLSLEIKGKQFIGIIGPNGSGKSTLLKAISRSIPCKKGHVYYGEQELFQLSFKESAQLIACLSQEHDMLFDFQVRELVMMGRYPYKNIFQKEDDNDDRIVEQALREVGLLKIQHKNYQHLSGGEKQRVLIARMIAQDSNILILDEPTNHLDITYQLNLFHFLKKTNCLVIAAIHDLNIASSFCDDLIVMKDQDIYCQGNPNEILTEKVLRDVFHLDVEIIKHPKKDQPVIVY